MNPNGGQPINLDQNPFEEILAQAAQPAAPQQPAPGTPPEEMPLELQEGKTGDNSKPLLAAIHNLHNFISLSTSDASEIRVVRNLISALTQLVAKDQERSFNGEGPQAPVEATQAPAAQAPAAPAPAAQPQTPQV